MSGEPRVEQNWLLSTLRKGVNQARTFKRAALQKLPKLVARKEREETPDI